MPGSISAPKWRGHPQKSRHVELDSEQSTYFATASATCVERRKSGLTQLSARYRAGPDPRCSAKKSSIRRQASAADAGSGPA